MAKYSIEFKKSAIKELQALGRRDLLAIKHKIDGLALDPRCHGCEKLSDREMYRIRCGDYRVLYTIADKVLIVSIVHIGHRREVYRQ